MLAPVSGRSLLSRKSRVGVSSIGRRPAGVHARCRSQIGQPYKRGEAASEACGHGLDARGIAAPFGCLFGFACLTSAPVRGWVIEGGSLAGKDSSSASSRFASSSAFCALVLAFLFMGTSPVRHSAIKRELQSVARIIPPILSCENAHFTISKSARLRTAPFRVAPRDYSAPVGCFEQASSLGMPSKGSVRESAYRGANSFRWKAPSCPALGSANGTGGRRESRPDYSTISGSTSSREVGEIRKSANPGAPVDATLSICMSST
jgi:hypothetical protein